MPNDRWIVITTINPPTRAIEVVAERCKQGWSAVVVGDTKSPPHWHVDGIDYLDVAAQKGQFGKLADLVPYRHYCRKNLGYLYAIRRGAKLILETDDDNIPYDSFGASIARRVKGRICRGPGWINIYQHFVSGVQIWPRGLPLDAIDCVGKLEAAEAEVDCPVQQYLADNDPDVDAIYRLTTKGSVFFDQGAAPVVMDRGAWVPFNSQNTVFFREAFPLLYLPCHVSFRMTDIWRSFVAQAALWVHGYRLSFHHATVEQVRNEHDLMRDFADEVVGYLHNRRIGEILMRCVEEIGASPSLTHTVKQLWLALEKAEMIPSKEREIIDAWLDEAER